MYVSYKLLSRDIKANDLGFAPNELSYKLYTM